MNRVFLHSKNNETNNIIRYIYILIPLFLFGFYKNGISLFINKSTNILGLFKIFILMIIAVLISFIFSKINKERFISYKLINNIIISLITFPSTNILIFSGVVIILNLILKYFKFNIASGYMVIYSFILILMNKFSFLNTYENTYELKLSFMDYLIGKGSGGIANTLIIYILIAFIFLIININYKKLIPIITLCIYYIFILFLGFIKGYFDPSLSLNSNLLFAVIFISTQTLYSPYTKGGMIIYSVILSLGLIISSFINIDLGLYISILLLSIITPLLDNLIINGFKKNSIEML